MKFILALIVFLSAKGLAFAESVGPLSVSVPTEPRWSLDLDKNGPKGARIIRWSNGETKEGVLLMRLPLPDDANGTLEDYVPDWRAGLEKKATKVFTGGFMTIADRRFGFLKIQADVGPTHRIVRQVCTICEKEVFVVGIFSDAGDPDSSKVLSATLDSIRVTDRRSDSK